MATDKDKTEKDETPNTPGAQPATAPGVETPAGDTAPAPPTPAPDETESKGKAKTLDVVRTSVLAWWCPNCDNSNEKSLEQCGKCGATLTADGKKVKTKTAKGDD